MNRMEGCGKPLDYATLATEIGADMELVEFVRWTRSLRYDVRSQNTNISLAPGVVLICYPFPRALYTISSVRIVREGQTEYSPIAILVGEA